MSEQAQNTNGSQVNPFAPSTAPNQTVDASKPQPPAGLALKKGGLLGRLNGAGAGRGNMVSPTDNMMSPVTAKLKDAKKNRFGRGAPAPFNLASQLSQSSVAPGTPSAGDAASTQRENANNGFGKNPF